MTFVLGSFLHGFIYRLTDAWGKTAEVRCGQKWHFLKNKILFQRHVFFVCSSVRNEGSPVLCPSVGHLCSTVSLLILILQLWNSNATFEPLFAAHIKNALKSPISLDLKFFEVILQGFGHLRTSLMIARNFSLFSIIYKTCVFCFFFISFFGCQRLHLWMICDFYIIKN